MFIALIAGAFWIYNSFLSTTSFITRATDIELPSWTSTIEAVDNAEFVAIGKYVIPKESISEFADQYLLSKMAGSNTPLDFDEYLSIENQSSRANLENCIFLDDCNGGNHWRVILNEVSGELWIEVTYPDMAGDTPPCDKN